MAKKKKNRIPKTIAGVTLPGFIRKSSLLRSLLKSKTGRTIAAQALTAAAGAIAAVLVEEREEVVEAGKKGARKGARAVGVATDAVNSAAHAVMGVVTDAAKSILPEGSDKDDKSHPAGKEAFRH